MSCLSYHWPRFTVYVDVSRMDIVQWWLNLALATKVYFVLLVRLREVWEVLWWACLFVCLFVCLSAHITSSIFCVLPVAVAVSSSDGVAIRYEFPVFRMSSCLNAIGTVGRVKHAVMFRMFAKWRYQLDVRHTVFGWVRHNAALGQSLLPTISLFLCMSHLDVTFFVFSSLIILSDWLRRTYLK